MNERIAPESVLQYGPRCCVSPPILQSKQVVARYGRSPRTCSSNSPKAHFWSYKLAWKTGAFRHAVLKRNSGEYHPIFLQWGRTTGSTERFTSSLISLGFRRCTTGLAVFIPQKQVQAASQHNFLFIIFQHHDQHPSPLLPMQASICSASVSLIDWRHWYTRYLMLEPYLLSLKELKLKNDSKKLLFTP